MNVTGLITEFNPFHNGHKYYVEQAKKRTDADFLIAVMSGNFTQRGEPAFIDKYARTEMALSCGIDLVLELPVYYATKSAEYFAFGAVDLLAQLGVVQTVCFGSECGNIHQLSSIAEILLKEPVKFKDSLKNHLKAGNTFPAARAHALSDYLREQKTYHTEELAVFETCLQSPNNILGIEYIKALQQLRSPMNPITISRCQNDYHDLTLSSGKMNTPPEHSEDFKNRSKNNECSYISSATSIRKTLIDSYRTGSSFPEMLKNHLPESSYAILKETYRKSCPVISNDLSLSLHHCLLLVKSPVDLMQYQDITPDLANRIFRLIPNFCNFESFVASIKTRQITETRIRRALLHILLNDKVNTAPHVKADVSNLYIRVLGFRKDAAVLLSEIKKRSCLPLITKLADSSSLLNTKALSMLTSDIFASNVYHSAVNNQFQQALYNEYTRQMIIL